MRWGAWIVGGVGGVLLGLVSGYSWGRRAGVEASVEQDSAAARPQLEREAPARSDREPELAAGEARVLPSERERVAEEEELFGARLAEYGREGLRAGWAKVRVRAVEMPADLLKEGLEEYREIVERTPFAIGGRLAKRENEREAALADLAVGGAMTLLARLDEGGVGPMPELVQNAETFAALFQRGFGEGHVGGTGHLSKPDEGIEDGITFQLPDGVFRLSKLMDDKDPFPSDVTIAGAGMNRTLVLMGSLSTRGVLRNFSVRDCTVHTESDYLFDLRTEPATAQFERVRLIGFDSGAGGSSLIATRGIAIWFRECRIEGGYGRSPGYGRLFDVRTDALLARFDACAIDLTRLVQHLRPGSTVVFSRCTLTNIRDLSTPETPSLRGVSFPGTTLLPLPSPPPEDMAKDLNDLFPNWRARIEPR